jgi:hypothetical protein
VPVSLAPVAIRGADTTNVCPCGPRDAHHGLGIWRSSRGPEGMLDRVLIRDATPDDWQAIWPFLRRIVAAGESFAWERDVS